MAAGERAALDTCSLGTDALDHRSLQFVARPWVAAPIAEELLLKVADLNGGVRLPLHVEQLVHIDLPLLGVTVLCGWGAGHAGRLIERDSDQLEEIRKLGHEANQRLIDLIAPVIAT